MRRPRLKLALACAAAVLATVPAAARADENPAEQAPFGGELPPPLEQPSSKRVAPPGFSLSAIDAIAVARRTETVRDELAETPTARPMASVRGDRWQVDYEAGGEVVAVVILDGTTGAVEEAWRDFQVSTPLARGYEGAVAQKVNAPYVWLPLCILFCAPFFDPRRPFRLLHLDLLVIVGLGLSLLYFNRAEITASVALTYPVLGYFLVRGLVAGLWPRERAGPLVPIAPPKLLAIGVFALLAARIVLNLVDSHVIDVGVAGVIGADRIAAGQPLYEGGFSPGLDLRGDVYGPFNYLAYLPFEQLFGWDGVWDADVPAAHAAAICFDLICVVGLVALGRRLREGAEGRALGWALGFAWVACPWTLYTMNANANDGLIAALGIGAMLALRSAPTRGALLALASAAKFGPAALAPLFATADGERRRRGAASLLGRLRDRRDRARRPVHPRRRAARALRPHARLPGHPQLAVQRLGAGALARVRATPRPGRRRSARGRRRLLAAVQDAGPDRGAGARGDDRGAADRHPLVLLLRRLVPAVRVDRELRLPATDRRAGLKRSSSAVRRAGAS